MKIYEAKQFGKYVVSDPDAALETHTLVSLCTVKYWDVCLSLVFVCRYFAQIVICNMINDKRKRDVTKSDLFAAFLWEENGTHSYSGIQPVSLHCSSTGEDFIFPSAAVKGQIVISEAVLNAGRVRQSHSSTLSSRSSPSPLVTSGRLHHFSLNLCDLFPLRPLLFFVTAKVYERRLKSLNKSSNSNKVNFTVSLLHAVRICIITIFLY